MSRRGVPPVGRLEIVHVVRSLDPAAGGVPIIALKLAVAQAAEGHGVRMLVYRVPGAEAEVRSVLAGIGGSDRVEVRYVAAEDRLEALTGWRAGRVAAELMASVDVAHLHGVWEPMLKRVASAARFAGRPYVLTPHGMLDPWSMGQSALKKKLALRLGVKRMLDGAMFLHLGNRDERELIVPLGISAPSELIPNGVYESEVASLPAPGVFRAAHPAVGDDPFVLFLSRLHFKKGLDYLAGAFAMVAGDFPRLRLVVAGPDGGARGEFEAAVSASGLSGRVHVVGPLYGEIKAAALVDCAVFCLPSRQEGFSMAITEAMGAGCPCVVTKACHYPEVEESGAGYCVELSAAGVAEGLARVLGDANAKTRMGAAGRALVLSRFTWPVIGRLAVDYYRKHGKNDGR